MPENGGTVVFLESERLAAEARESDDEAGEFRGVGFGTVCARGQVESDELIEHLGGSELEAGAMEGGSIGRRGDGARAGKEDDGGSRVHAEAAKESGKKNMECGTGQPVSEPSSEPDLLWIDSLYDGTLQASKCTSTETHPESGTFIKIRGMDVL